RPGWETKPTLVEERIKDEAFPSCARCATDAFSEETWEAPWSAFGDRGDARVRDRPLCRRRGGGRRGGAAEHLADDDLGDAAGRDAVERGQGCLEWGADRLQLFLDAL